MSSKPNDNQLLLECLALQKRFLEIWDNNEEAIARILKSIRDLELSESGLDIPEEK